MPALHLFTLAYASLRLLYTARSRPAAALYACFTPFYACFTPLYACFTPPRRGLQVQNYDREVAGERPELISLHRVFYGNPGAAPAPSFARASCGDKRVCDESKQGQLPGTTLDAGSQYRRLAIGEVALGEPIRVVPLPRKRGG
jgi:hypothetical protein